MVNAVITCHGFFDLDTCRRALAVLVTKEA